MEERRRAVRALARLMVRAIQLPDGPTRSMTTKDISLGGFCCLAEQVLSPGTVFQMAIGLPGREPPRPCTGEVVWSHPYETVSQTGRERGAEMGIRIAEIAPADREAISVFVQNRGQPPI